MLRHFLAPQTSPAKMLVPVVVLLLILGACSSTGDAPGAASAESDGGSAEESSGCGDGELGLGGDECDDADALAEAAAQEDPVEDEAEESDSVDSDSESDESAADDSDTAVVDEVDADWLGGRNSRLTSIRLAAGMLDPCGDAPISTSKLTEDAPAEIRAQLEEVNDTLRRVRRSCEEEPEVFDRSLAALVRDLGTFVSAQVEGAPALSLNRVDPANRVAAVVAAYEWGAWALSGGARIDSHANALWTSHVQRGRVLSLAADGNGRRQTVLGSSQAIYAVNPTQLGEGAYHLGLPSAPPSALEAFVAATLAYLVEPPALSIVAVSLQDMLTPAGESTCAEGMAGRLQATFTMTDTLYEGVPGIAATSVAELAADPNAAALLQLAPLAAPYGSTFSDQGRLNEYPELSQDLQDLRNERSLEAFETFEVCENELASLQRLVARDEVGSRVAIVALPMHSELRSVAGEEQLSDLVERLNTLSDRTEVVDLTTLLPDEEFLDYTLTTESGAALVSTRLGELIA